jgi:hypothetical protein
LVHGERTWTKVTRLLPIIARPHAAIYQLLANDALTQTLRLTHCALLLARFDSHALLTLRNFWGIGESSWGQETMLDMGLGKS